MRAWLVIGLILAGLLVAGGVLAVGKPERTQVPTIELRAETTEGTTTEPFGHVKRRLRFRDSSLLRRIHSCTKRESTSPRTSANRSSNC